MTCLPLPLLPQEMNPASPIFQRIFSNPFPYVGEAREGRDVAVCHRTLVLSQEAEVSVHLRQRCLCT